MTTADARAIVNDVSAIPPNAGTVEVARLKGALMNVIGHLLSQLDALYADPDAAAKAIKAEKAAEEKRVANEQPVAEAEPDPDAEPDEADEDDEPAKKKPAAKKPPARHAGKKK